MALEHAAVSFTGWGPTLPPVLLCRKGILVPAKPTPDPRHSALRAYILIAYENVTGLAAPWSAKHAGILANFLRSCPWDIGILTAAVDNRFQSQNINPCQDPCEWIMRLTNYAHGPLDKYQRPMRRKVYSDPLEGFETAAEAFARLERGRVN